MGHIYSLIFHCQLVICRLMFINIFYVSKSLETSQPQCQGFDCRSFWICVKETAWENLNDVSFSNVVCSCFVVFESKALPEKSPKTVRNHQLWCKLKLYTYLSKDCIYQFHFIQSIPILFQIEKSSNLSMHARVLPEKENIPSILRENRMY